MPWPILQEGDAAVWELLGYATRIWHIASKQLPVTPTEKLAADRIFSYWTSREAWLVGFHCQHMRFVPNVLLYCHCQESKGALLSSGH